MCAFCYVYEIEVAPEGFLAAVEKPRTAMIRTKCRCKCDSSSMTQYEGNSQCEKCEHFVIGKDKAGKIN